MKSRTFFSLKSFIIKKSTVLPIVLRQSSNSKLYTPNIVQASESQTCLNFCNERSRYSAELNSTQKSLCTEYSVTSITQSRKNIVLLVQSLIERSKVYIHIGMLFCNSLYPLRRCHKAHQPDTVEPVCLQA